VRTAHGGVALITALLVVAIASLAATALLTSANLAIHRMNALRDSEQAWWVARGVEAWVLGILDKDAKERDYDGLDEDWAAPVDYLPVEQGFVRGNIVDLQGRFNLNGLAKEHDPAGDRRKQFERLLRGVSAAEVPPTLVPAILDWIDEDQNPGFPSGAEDTAYQGMTPPYRAANRPFTVVSELLAVQGMTPELYAVLRDRVSALPEPTPINVNTAPDTVIRALSDSVDEAKLAQFIERRKEQPALTIDDFIKEGIVGADAPKADLAVASRYFQIQGEVFVGSSRVALYSLIHRPDPGTPTVLAHSADAE
jgi:general secretion pathway protein K